MVDTWIKRSKSVPLEICVDFGRTCTVEHASRVATLLSPHIERWRMLCWECTLGLEAIFDAMRGKETPLLEVLSLDDRACRGVEYDEQLSNPFAVASSAPKLTVVEFRTIATITNFWADHPFRNLTSLEIATGELGHPIGLSSLTSSEFPHVVDTKPTLDQLLDLLRACPMLEALSIRYEYSEAEGDQPSAPQMASRIPLLALKSLSLRDFNTPNSVNTLLSFIHAPNLSYLDLLDLYCDTPDEDPDFSEIFRFLKDTAEAFGDFLNVQAMRLGGIACKCTSPFLHMFLWRFTNLRKLHLVEHDEDDPSFAKSLLDFVGHSRSFFPRLEVLKTSGIKGRVLMTVAKRRMRIGAPLKTVIYHEDDEEKIRTWKARLQALGVVVESCDDEPIHAE